jgi:OOP family OmpA-OmpF porin
MRIDKFKRLLVAVGFGLALGCASNAPRVQMPLDANAAEEISKFEVELAEARAQQVDLVSPKSFKRAEKRLEAAKKQRAKGKDQQDILVSIGEGKAALNVAIEKAPATANALFDVMEARKQAQAAGTMADYNREMQNIDDDLYDYTEDYEAGKGEISQRQRDSIRTDYLNLELKAIQNNNLSQAKNLIENAEKKKASKFAPKSLDMANAKVKHAETVIATNRHDQASIQAASQDATAQAYTLMRVTTAANGTNGQSNEEVAIEMDRKDNLVAAGNQRLALTNKTILTQQDQIADKTNELGAMSDKNSDLKQKEAFNQSLTDAERAFPADQADVYRQGDKLVIRLKAVNFPSGRAELGGKTFSILNQVKEVLTSLKAEQVVVEGHTDSLGGVSLNRRLSQERASAVADYLISTKVVKKGQVESQGFGFDKPISSNKTKAGREQNRRVDIIVTPTAIR